MKSIIFFAFIGACAATSYPPYAQPNHYTYYPDSRPNAAFDRNAAILRYHSEVNDRGYNFAYETENGIQAEETGREANGIQATGAYSYVGDDGRVYSVRYTAGSNGFQPYGAHLPSPYNARDESYGNYNRDSYHQG